MATYNGTTGADTLTASTSADLLNGDAGHDMLLGLAGVDTLNGGTGNDTLNGGLGNDGLFGGDGVDTASYLTATGAVTVNMATNSATGADGNDGLNSIENIIGSNYNDTLTGNALDNIIAGGLGADVMTGGDGVDTLDYRSSNAAVQINLADGSAAGGHAANDVLAGFEDIIGSAYADSLVGDAGDNMLTGGAGADTLDGGVGFDVASYATATAAVSVNLLLGSAQGNDAEADLLISIEGLAGSAFNDTLTGNLTDNLLYGDAGDDNLNGGGGNDTMIGGIGNDTYSVNAAGDVIIEDLSAGVDLVQSAVAWVLDDNFENLTLTGMLDVAATGNAMNNIITGNSGIGGIYGSRGENVLSGLAGNDTLYGGAGADTLDGGTGNDSMVGGTESDTYIVDSLNDVVVEVSGQGVDTVQTGLAYVLGDYVENLTLTGTAALTGTGNIADNILTGNSGANLLAGLIGNDTLIGGDGNDSLDGGTGNDSMVGGLGDDVYYVDATTDTTRETAASGDDTVISTVSLTLTSDIENLLLSGVASLNGTGNTTHNAITGTSAANTLLGLAGNDTLNGGGGDDSLDGGSGVDSLVGGTGNDSYVVDNSADVAIELAGQGNDTVRASVDWVMGAEIETLIQTGIASIDATGNALGNSITGTTGSNVLLGMAGNDTITSGSGSDTLDGGTGNDILTGGLGDDTYIIDSAADVVVEAAAAGRDHVMASVTHFLGTDFENLTLTGVANLAGTGNGVANVITGNAGANVLIGLGGNDTLYGNDGEDSLVGGEGNDSMVGGNGSDVYYVDDIGDKTIEGVTGGVLDTVSASITHTLASYIENLMLTGTGDINGTGNSAANVIIGNMGHNLLEGELGNDSLIGDHGNDTLDGGAGNDTMRGGEGDDIYHVDSLLDAIVEQAAQGTDSIVSSITYTLFNNFEHLTLTGSSALLGTGNTANNRLIGNTGANKLYGLEGNDSLDGGAGADLLDGGTGNDILTGGLGDDSYVVDTSFDVIVELDNEGTDTVTAMQSYALVGSLERLILGGTGNFSGAGSEVSNSLTGNAGNNLLSGLAGNDTLTGGAGNDTLDGGTGNDSMVGGLGNDIYTVDSVTDRVVEALSSGTDTVQSSVAYVLGTTLENLTLTGSAHIKGTGNSAANNLTGNTGDNLLLGMNGNDTLTGGAGNDTLDGGSGNDVMIGGLGDDTYFVSSLGDMVIELADQGIDTLRSTLTKTLDAVLENLTLLGTAAVNGTGNAANNVLTGNAGSNKLYGLDGADSLIGGLGNDFLTGGNGADHFVFTALRSGTDTITDYNALNGGGPEGDVMEFVGLLKGAFSYRGTATFTGGSDNSEARVVGNKLYMDFNGDAVIDSTIVLTGLTSAAQLTVDDFLFT